MIAILLLDFGGPESLKDVRPFLKNLFSDKSIFPFPFAQNFFAWITAFLRAPKVAKQYQAIGGASPLPKQSKDLASQLEKSLKAANLEARVFVGMRYFKPYIMSTLQEVAKNQPSALIVLPMFPHYSTATTLSVLSEFESAYRQWGLDIPYQTIDWWYDHPQYIAAWCYSIKKALDRFEERVRKEVSILFSAHSLPESFVRERKDPYPDQIKECCSKVMTSLGGEHFAYISYQSKVGPIEWLKPATIDFVQVLGKKGVENLVIVPISFVTDHIETLYEIDQEIIPAAKKAGILNVVRCDALYYTPYLKRCLEGLVFKKLLRRN